MDYAERGTVEKTLDRLVDDGTAISDGLDADVSEIVHDGQFSPEGRAYLTGLLSGIIATIRTFSETDSGLDDEDIEEIRRIAASREQEMLAVLNQGREG